MEHALVVVLVLLVLAALTQAAFAARALVLERREGMAPSWVRLGATGGVALAVLLVALSAILARPQPPIPRAPSVPADDPQVVALEKELAEKRKAYTDASARALAASDEVAKVRAKLAELGWDIEPESTADPRAFADALLGRTFICAALVIAGAALLLLLGDPATLAPAAWRRLSGQGRGAKVDQARRDTVRALDELTLAAANEKHPDGLKAAARVRRELLDRVEEIDFLWLSAFCACGHAFAGEDGKPLPGERRRGLFRSAARDLESLLEIAPNVGEAEWLLGVARFMGGEFEKALAAFRAARPKLKGERLPFAENESACLLHLAEERLQAADAAGANALFDEVAKQKVLAKQVPVVLVESRLVQVRDALRQSRFDEVQKGIELVRAVEGLAPEQKRSADVACSVFELLATHRSGDLAGTLAGTEKLLKKWMPEKLPPVSDRTADEYLFPDIEGLELVLPASFFRAVWFLRACALAEREAKKGKLGDSSIKLLREALLRALQFEPRHREVLAALAVLDYWFGKDRAKALAWLEAAVSMGVHSQTARRILDRDKQLEQDRKGLLERWFSMQSRYLADASVRPHVKKALVEELGAFQEFRPVLVELDRLPEAPPRSPTVETLRDRARYVDEVVSDVVRRGDPTRTEKLATVQKTYAAVVDALERSASELESLEKKVLEEAGRAILK